MKKLFSIILLLMIVSKSNAQWVTIPDTSFVNYLTLRFPLCMNGNQMDTTCSDVLSATSISGSTNIISLEGIQYFDSLRTLSISGSMITSLPRLPAQLSTLYCVDNQLTSLPALPDSLNSLFVSINQLTSLPILPATLRSLRCEGNPLTTLPALPSDLVELYCGSCPITSLPPLPNSLGYLMCSFDTSLTLINSFPSSLIKFDCYGCNLSSLPVLPATLESLIVSWNPLNSIPALPATLTSLQCRANNLTTIPNLPAGLIDLDCEQNQLTSLPSLPTTLQYLSCSENQITSLPTLPDSLKQLICNRNQLTTLPPLPNSLLRIFCYENQISSLPALNDSLIVIDCQRNLITSLPVLNDSLLYLNCTKNLLTGLPAFNQALQTIFCDSNQITILPAFPPSLLNLSCPGNLITTLPELPDSMNALYIYNNPNLTCLPELKKVNALIFYNTGIQCLPNYGSVGGSNPPMNAYPLCQPFNINSCTAFWNIDGRLYSDLNSDCVSDTIESGLKNIKVQLYRNSVLEQQTLSNDGGVYAFAADTGSYTYTVDTTGLPFELTCPPGGFHSSMLTLADSMDSDMNFGFNCNPGFDVGVNSIILRSRNFFPGDSANVNIGAGDLSSFYGLRCATGVSGDVSVTISGPVSFLSAAAGALNPVVAGNLLTYTISDFGTVNFTTDFRIILLADSTSQLGDSVCITVNVNPLSDNDPLNNVFQNCFIIGNSYDPNTKEVNPEGDIAADQEWLTYTIHFQNTGTAPAQHIYIVDTLDSNLELSTFTLIANSHNMTTQLNGNKILFDFVEINLPDSTNDEANSHGYVQYKIKLKPGLSVGSQIRNTARIYFDFNQPVITNTITTNVSFPVKITETIYSDNVFIYPNPASSELNVISADKMINRIELFDIVGKNVLVQNNDKSGAVNIQLKFLTKGIYFLKIYNDREIVKKIVVQ
ncbi:MAG: T9SS type A sorting domain-containing protein [Bacteroidia bacterium]|nr:T9SS type A sorting domain-containing protein [Bacteroidia bacterium]MBP6657590.1 T9SS type A sorting domain-containing protein [Bacteroidia bacterium]